MRPPLAWLLAIPQAATAACTAATLAAVHAAATVAGVAVSVSTATGGTCTAAALRAVQAASAVADAAATISIALVVAPLARAARAPLDAADALGAWLAPAVAHPAGTTATVTRPPPTDSAGLRGSASACPPAESAGLRGSGGATTEQSCVAHSALELGVTTVGVFVGASTAIAILPLYAALVLTSVLSKHIPPGLSELFRTKGRARQQHIVIACEYRKLSVCLSVSCISVYMFYLF
jgi:hypothetical protein